MNDTHEVPPLLYAVMSAGEVEAVYHLPQGTVTQEIRRGKLKGRRAGKVFLVCRADADARWGDRARTDDPPTRPTDMTD